MAAGYATSVPTSSDE